MEAEAGDVVIVQDAGRFTPYLIDGYDEEMEGLAGFPIRFNAQQMEVDDCLHLIDGCGVVVLRIARAEVPRWKQAVLTFEPEE